MKLDDVISAMAEAGCSAEQIGQVSLALSKRPERSGAAIRQARYRENKKAKSVTRDVTSDITRDVTPPSPSPPIENHNPPIPSPGSVSNETLVPAVREDAGERRKEHVELCQMVVALWNDLAASLRLPEVRDITASRQAAIRQRSKDLVETYDFPDPLAGWRAAAGKVRASPFLRGESGFRCDFDFLVRASSFTRIMEGRYEGTTQKRNFGR